MAANLESKHFPTAIEERKNGKVAIVTLNLLPPNNTFTRPLLLEFVDHMNALAGEVDAVIVTSGHEKFFSNGLDGKYLLDSNTEERAETVAEMIRFFGKMHRFPRPWVAEITGYCMAGGAVLASTADYRYMISAGGRIGFSELAVGLPLPLVYLHGLHKIVHPASVRSLMEGAALKPDEAREIGLIDGTADTPGDLRKMTLKRVDQMLRMEQDSFLPTRNLYRGALLREIERDEPDDIRQAAELVKMPVFERAVQNIAGKNR